MDFEHGLRRPQGHADQYHSDIVDDIIDRHHRDIDRVGRLSSRRTSVADNIVGANQRIVALAGRIDRRQCHRLHVNIRNHRAVSVLRRPRHDHSHVIDDQRIDRASYGLVRLRVCGHAQRDRDIYDHLGRHQRIVGFQPRLTSGASSENKR